MDILYYSTNCIFSQKLLQYLAKNGLSAKMNFLSVDRRSVDPNSGQIHLLLDRGTKVLLPPNVQSVPSLVLVSQNFRVLTGNEIYAHLTPKLQDMNDRATGNNGEPLGYQIGSGAVVSEKFTDYGMSPEELSSKGRGGMRQMHNYVAAAHIGFSIPTPKDEYKADKIGEVDMESLQQKRNTDVVKATQNMPIIEINHQNYAVPAPRGPPQQQQNQMNPNQMQMQPRQNQHQQNTQNPKQIPAHYYTHQPQQQQQFRGGSGGYANSYMVNI